MPDSLELRVRALEAKSLAYSIAISASLLSIYINNKVGLEDLRATIVDGIKKHFGKDNVDDALLQMTLDEVGDLFRLFTTSEAL
jgi:hypothetical protein